MKTLVTIFTYNRPEYLWLAVENLAGLDGSDQADLWIAEDTHPDQPKSEQVKADIAETIEFAKEYFPNLVHIVNETPSGLGFSGNVIETYKKVVETDYDILFHHEDDVLFTFDWLRFGKQALEQFTPFAVCANADPREQLNDAQFVNLRTTWYQTFGLAYRVKNLNNVLLPEFKDYGLSKGHEFDTWVLDFMKMYGLFTASPTMPRGYHYGAYSVHNRTGKPFKGTLGEKVREVALATKYPSRFGDNDYTFTPFPEKQPQWDKLIARGRQIYPATKRR